MSSDKDHFSKARHDLRTPVNQIIGYSELLQEQAEDDGQTEYIPDLQKINTAARRQLEMIEAYLSPSAIQQVLAVAGGAAPEPAGVSAPEGSEARAASDLAAVAAAPPRATPEAGDDVVVQDPSRDSGALAAQGGPLLVVDDNEMNRDMLSRRLSARKFNVKVAEDGHRALAMIEQEKFDMVLLDVMMPGISGIDVLKTLRETYSMADLPIIMATAKDQSEDIVQALKLGANDYVVKPLDFPVVLARVQTQLALKRQKDEIQRLAEHLEVRNRFIRNTFGRYLSDEVVESLLESPEGLKLGGEKKTVTIMMSDLRAFTSVSERLGPEQVVRMLNRYLGEMTDIIMKHQGTIDEFIGDAILAIFGAPMTRDDDALRAVACAAEMQLAMERVNADNELGGLPHIEMGIAVHTGEVVVGNIGSQKRTKYGIVGPPVNLTGRIESYTVGGQVLISESTFRDAGSVVEIGERIEVKAKGASEPLYVYDLRGVGSPYAMKLPGREIPMTALARPIPIRYFAIAGKQVGDVAVAARLTRLGETGAEAQSEASLPPLSNVKVELLDDAGQPLLGDLYAKITEVRGEDGRTLVLRFTAVPPPVELFVKETLRATPA